MLSTYIFGPLVNVALLSFIVTLVFSWQGNFFKKIRTLILSLFIIFPCIPLFFVVSIECMDITIVMRSIFSVF